MALSNEAYVVHTATAGDVIVPLKQTVPYLNINLIGYQYFSYYSVMSQNLANIVDDIKTLQDGGLAKTTFDLDKLIADAEATINSKIDLFNGAIMQKIVDYTDQVITDVNTKVDNFTTVLNGNGSDDIGVIAKTANVVTAVGNNDSGIVQQINVLNTAVGIGNTDGLLQQLTGSNDIVSNLAIDVNNNKSDLQNIHIMIEADNTGLQPRLAVLETTIRGDVQLNKSMIFGDGTYNGLLKIVGNDEAGLLHDTKMLRSDYDTKMNNITPRISALELNLGSDTTSGALGDIATLNTNLNTVKNIVGDDVSSGLQLKIKNIEDFNIPQIKDTLNTADTGLVDKTAALRTDVDKLMSDASSTNNDTAANISDLQNQVTANTSDISTANTNISTTNTNISTLTSALNDAGGINDQLTNMPTTITDNNLTYDNSGTAVVFSPAVLFKMKTQTDNLFLTDVVTRFEGYFGDSSNKMLDSDIGKLSLNNWITDTSNDGFLAKTDAEVNKYLNANYSVDDIKNNKDAIAIINNDSSTTGSIANAVQTLKQSIEESLTGPNGYITIINSGDTTDGSTDKKIKDSVDAYSATVNNQFSTINANITNLVTTVQNNAATAQQNLDDQTEELQIEMVRYDTILPFLQKMFKQVNDSGSIENSEIDDIFENIINRVNQIDKNIVLQDYTLHLNTDTNKFEIFIKLDKDLYFDALADGTYATIIRTADNYSAPTGLDDKTTDVYGSLALEDGLYQAALDAKLYQDSDDTTGVDITDLTADDNDTIELQFATRDMFNTYVVHHIKIN